MMIRRRIKLLLLISASFVYIATATITRSSCCDHFLNGEYETRVLPIGDDSRGAFRIECVMPKKTNPQLPVETIVRNALEKTYRLADEKRTIGYQISEYELLREIITSADSCEQQLQIEWPPLRQKRETIFFTVESVFGKTRTFNFNETGGLIENVKLTKEDVAGVVHLLPGAHLTAASAARITLSSLRCRHAVVADKKCEFELNAVSHFVEVATAGATRFSFALRTDVPDGSLLELKGGGTAIVRLSQGYIVSIVATETPVPMLADGNWHTLTVDLAARVLYVDGVDRTALAFSASITSIRAARVLVNGTITAVQLDAANAWLCAGASALTSRAEPQLMRRVCPPNEASYCHCQAPSAALGALATASREAAKCVSPTLQEAIPESLTMTRDPQKLAFLYLSTSMTRSVSVQMRTDAGTGLVFFGQRVLAPGGNRTHEVFQAHFEGARMIAALCTFENQDAKTCQSCQIRRPNGFATNEWMRVTLIKHTHSWYLTVNEQICKLSPSHELLKSNEMYMARGRLDFLFIGGTPYHKSANFRGTLNSTFYERFYEKTYSKPPSLRGCIAGLFVDAQPLSLIKHYNEQVHVLASNHLRLDSVFAMKHGCAHCSLDCGSAPCRMLANEAEVCDCSHTYGAISEGAKCEHDKNDVMLRLSAVKPASLSMKWQTSPQQKVVRMWMHVRFPTAYSDKTLFMQFGSINVWVDTYGRRVLIDSDAYQFAETFYIQSLDERLHLIAMEETPEIGVIDDYKYVLRVDAERRVLTLPRTIWLQNIVHAHVQAAATPSGSASFAFGGCLSGWYFALDTQAERQSNLSMINVLNEMSPLKRHIAGDPGVWYKDNFTSLALYEMCGVRDPLMWEASSATLGLVDAYTPEGTAVWRTGEHALSLNVQRISGAISASWLLWILALIGVIVALAIVAVLVYRQVQKHSYNVDEHEASSVHPDKQPLYADDVANSQR